MITRSKGTSLARYAFVFAGVALLAGCALPGYQTKLGGDHWYNFGSHSEAATYQDQLSKKSSIDYKPRLVKITPALVAHQKMQRKHEKLGPDVQKLTAQPKNIEYKVGPGDILRITVYGHPELTNPGGSSSSGSDLSKGQRVNSDGDIYYPYVGEIHVAGLSMEQIRRVLTRKLSSYVRDPQLNVSMLKYRSKRVYISGDTVQPCTISLNDIDMTAIRALSKCSALGSSASKKSKEGGSTGVRNVLLVRNGHSTMLNLNRIATLGQEVPLEAGDRLLIDDTANRVFMVGEFGKQKALPFTVGGMSLSDAISDVGGLNLETANPDAVYVVRGFVSGRHAEDGGVKTTMRPDIYKLDMSNASGMLLANQFELKPRDVVFAAPASLVNFNRALAQITPSLDQIFRTLILVDRFK